MRPRSDAERAGDRVSWVSIGSSIEEARRRRRRSSGGSARRSRSSQLLRGFALVHEYRLGDDPALEKLRTAVPLAKELLAAGKRPSQKDLDVFEAQLDAQLRRVEGARKQLAPDVTDYEGSQLELDALRAQTVERLRLGRTTMILWARSHRNLGKGIAVPASIDLAAMIKNSALSAAKAAIPF